MTDQQKTLMEFNMIYKEMDELYHAIALKMGLSDSALFILYTLYQQGSSCLQKDICDAISLSKQTVNSSIKKLEQDGYLYLQQGSGRDKHIHLSPAGGQLLDEKIRPVVEMEQQAFALMPESERRTLLQLTRKYLRNLQAQAENLQSLKPL